MFTQFRRVTGTLVDPALDSRGKGPRELVDITRDGCSAIASARLTTGDILIWSTRQVALRLEGNFGRTAALAIASAAH